MNGVHTYRDYVAFQHETCSGLIADGLGEGSYLVQDDVFFHTLISKSSCYASGLVLRMDLTDVGLRGVLSAVSQHLKKGIDSTLIWVTLRCF